MSVNVGFVQQLAELEQRVRGSCSLDPREYAVQDLWSMVKAGFVSNESGQDITEAHCRAALQAHPVDADGVVGAMCWLESANLELLVGPNTAQTAEDLTGGATAAVAGGLAK